MKHFFQAFKDMSCSGRVSRKSFWWFYLFAMIFMFGTLYILATIILAIDGGPGIWTFIPLALVIAIGAPTITMQIKRLHDVGRSGWWLLCSFIPYLGTIILIIFLVQRGQPDTNKYGPVPFDERPPFV